MDDLGIKCPGCGKLTKTEVFDTRGTIYSEIRRRRECKECGCRFTTYERVAGDNGPQVSRDGNFDQDVLLQKRVGNQLLQVILSTRRPGPTLSTKSPTHRHKEE